MKGYLKLPLFNIAVHATPVSQDCNRGNNGQHMQPLWQVFLSERLAQPVYSSHSKITMTRYISIF